MKIESTDSERDDSPTLLQKAGDFTGRTFSFLKTKVKSGYNYVVDYIYNKDDRRGRQRRNNRVLPYMPPEPELA
jgi:hypothetical protein